MSFAENLQFLRKQKEITQEQLAEQLEVSRQSVSKWESGISYPEMEKLLQICSMFHCNMDTLMQGDVSRSFATDSYGYDSFQNLFSKMIALGVALILTGISVMSFLCGFGLNEEYASAVFFAFVIIAVMIFVVMGMQHEQFRRKYPVIEDFYTEEEKDAGYRKFTVRIAVGVATILIGVLFFLVAGSMTEEGVTVFGRVQEQTEEILTGVFMLILAAGVALLVYGSIQKDKYNIENYNKEGNPSPEKKKKDSLIGMLCGCIFLAATAIYLVWSFMMDSWAVSWIVFAVAGLLCGIVALVVSGGRDEGNQA